MLMFNTTLKELCLDGQIIDVFKRLGKKKHNQVFTGNNIKSEGARMLSEGLKENRSLQKLMLGGIVMKNRDVKHINDEAK